MVLIAKKSKTALDFSDLESFLNEFPKLEEKTEEMVENGLKKVFTLVTTQLEPTIASHHKTGKTESTLKKDNKVKWDRNLAYIDTGFDLDAGGYPSIFLMHGTPTIKPDKKMYNAVYGAKTRKTIQQILQESVIEDMMRFVDGI